MSGPVFTPVSPDNLFMSRCQVLFSERGTDRFVNLGDFEELGTTPNLTEIERFSKEYPTSTLVRTDVIRKDVSISMTAKSLTPAARAMLFMAASTKDYLVQAAVAAGEAIFEDVNVGDIFSLGARDISVTSVTDGAVSDPVTYVLGTHYRIDRRTGYLEITAIPSGAAGTDIEVSFSAPAITAADKRQHLGVLAGRGIRGRLFIRGISDSDKDHIEATFWDVEIRPSGDIALQGGDDFGDITLTGRVYADGTRPAGKEIGEVAVIPRAPLV
jgi:hypothetical protein